MHLLDAGRRQEGLGVIAAGEEQLGKKPARNERLVHGMSRMRILSRMSLTRTASMPLYIQLQYFVVLRSI